MSDLRTCPQCGAEFPREMLAGACPKCVARALLRSGGQGDGEGATGGGARVRYVGDYELLEEIGRGGMGIVFKARQLSLNRLVAVKMLLHGSFATEAGVRRFHAEAEAAASLRHPNIVSVHEVGTHEGYHYFSMDYVEGTNLSQLCGGKPLDPRQSATCVRVVAEAIHHAHQHGIIHRDLKPSNILIDSREQPHITDFGLSKRLDGTGEMTLSGQVLGAPSFMAPEQAAGKGREVGVASDVYALGAVLYSLLTGQPPFIGESVTATLAQVQHDQPKPPHRLNSAVPRDLEAICLKCLRKNPRQRYATAADLAADLRRWLASEPVMARPPDPAERTWRWCRGHPVPASLAVATCLAGLGAALFWPRPPPLRIPPGVTELIMLLDTTESLYPVCITDPQGSFWHRLPISSREVDISPEGDQVCFTRQDSPTNASIWISRLDGSGKTRVWRDGAHPRWLDARTLIYETLDLAGLWAVDIKTRATRELFRWTAITTNGCAGTPEPSPDRRRLLVNPQNRVLNSAKGTLVLHAPTADLYVCDPDGRNVQVVWEDVGDHLDIDKATADQHQVWVGTNRIAWCRSTKPGNRVQDMAVVTCRLGETNFQALTPWKGYNYPVAGSPDGQRILYLTEDAPGVGNLELWTMKVDGTNRRKVVNRKFSCDLFGTARWIKRPTYGATAR